MASDARAAAITALVQDGDAVRDTIQLVREKHQGDDAVLAVNFRGSSSGRLVCGFVGIRWSEDSGWRTAGSSWSSILPELPTEAIWRSSGGWRGVAGGWVNEPTASTIKVTDPSGRIEEDTIEQEAAILIWEGDFHVWRATVELLDEDGNVLRAGPMHPPPQVLSGAWEGS